MIDEEKEEEGETNEVNREANAHEVARLVLGQVISAEGDDAPELVLRLATGETTDGVAGKVSLDEPFEADFAEVGLEGALDDAEEVLKRG